MTSKRANWLFLTIILVHFGVIAFLIFWGSLLPDSLVLSFFLSQIISNAFEKATGVKLNYQIVGRRAGDIEKVWANPKFANEELGWKAVESIEDTLLSAWNWQLKLRERGIQ